jgi:hypothetical protein
MLGPGVAARHPGHPFLFCFYFLFFFLKKRSLFIYFY